MVMPLSDGILVVPLVIVLGLWRFFVRLSCSTEYQDVVSVFEMTGSRLSRACSCRGQAFDFDSRKARVNQRSRLGSDWRENFGGDKRNAITIHKRKESAVVIRELSTYGTWTSHSRRKLTDV